MPRGSLRDLRVCDHKVGMTSPDRTLAPLRQPAGRGRPHFLGWRVVALCWLAQNCAIGLSCGSYGAALTTLQRDIGANRAEVSYGLGVMLLTLGLVSPLVGAALQRIRVRAVMVAGALLNVAGYVLLTRISMLWQLIAIFALLIGPGACMLSMIPASTIVSRWFEKDRGKALAITNMPAFMLIVPPIAARLVASGGTHVLYWAIAAAFVALLPVLVLIVERPEHVGQTMRREDTAWRGGPGQAPVPKASRDIWGDHRFWLLSLGVGILTGCGSVYTTHIIPIVTDRGIPLATAALPMSAFGAGTLIGSVVFGWLIDRFGAVPMLIVNAAAQFVLWALLAYVVALMPMAAIGLVIGACMGALVALHGSALSEMFGPACFSRAMGFSYLVKVPFLFGLTPLAGHLYDVSGNYRSALLGVCGLAAITLAMFVALRLVRGAVPPARALP
jgi:MFS family permease